ncbi:TAXI family TRAP transporter solute-binding subunit [Thiovibrio sp. JS02]
MKNKRSSLLRIVAGCLLLLVHSSPSLADKREIIIAGGPAGGTFERFAEAVESYRKFREDKTFRFTARPSAGSVDNLQAVHAGRADFGVVYSGHLYQGRNGRLPDHAGKYDKALAIASLYGAPAQLVVRKNSGIRSAKDLVGKRVGVGNSGSGAYANCKIFFSHLGIWEKIKRIPVGYNDAAAAFVNNELDAFWLFSAYPSGAVIIAGQTRNVIDLVNLDTDAKGSGFYKKYPYFARISIPAYTYFGVSHPTPTFQDSTLLVARADLDEEVVARLLATIYSERGLAYMAKQQKAFKEMSIRTGTRGIVTPMHPGAVKFWKKRGLL